MTELHQSRAQRSAPELPSQRGEQAAPPPVVQQQHALPAAATGVIDLALERRDDRTGALLRRVVVTDVADTSPSRRLRQAQIAARDQLLRANPEWLGPSVAADGTIISSNEVAAWLYDESPALQEWRGRLVPSARALFPLQRPQASHLPTGVPIDDKARGFFLDGLDAIGIRTRGAVLREVVGRASARWTSGGRHLSTWVSLACGGALPVLDSLSALAPHELDLVLVDIDPVALDFARDLVTQQGLPDKTVRYLERDLVRSVVVRDDLVEELGPGSAAVVDALGIFEYFSDAACVRLLRNAHRLVTDGGVLVVANMLSDRPELHWNKRGIGWPMLRERSVEQLLGLVAEAGLETRRTTVTIPQDGVYAVVSIDC